MKNEEIYNLENILDKTKFANIDVAIHYGDKLINNIDEIQKHLKMIFNSLKDSNKIHDAKKLAESLQEVFIETKMMQIAITDMKNYLQGYKAKKEPSVVEEIAASKEWDFTEDELQKLEKYQQPDFTPEEQSKLQKYDPSKYKEE
jgi:hypothetical protein